MRHEKTLWLVMGSEPGRPTHFVGRNYELSISPLDALVLSAKGAKKAFKKLKEMYPNHRFHRELYDAECLEACIKDYEQTAKLS